MSEPASSEELLTESFGGEWTKGRPRRTGARKCVYCGCDAGALWAWADCCAEHGNNPMCTKCRAVTGFSRHRSPPFESDEQAKHKEAARQKRIAERRKSQRRKGRR